MISFGLGGCFSAGFLSGCLPLLFVVLPFLLILRFVFAVYDCGLLANGWGLWALSLVLGF